MAEQPSPIRIGLMAPFSGLVERYGQEISWAGQIATDEINEAGGVLGRPLELVVVDDGSLPDTAVPAANRLIDEEGCIAIIGNLLSNSRISVANMVAEPRKIPYLNFSFHEGAIWSRYFFHFAALPNQQIEKMIPYMAKKFGLKMFFAGNNYEWPRGSIDAAKRSLLELGGEILGEVYLPIGTDQFDDLLGDVGRSGADVFVPYFAGSDQTNMLTRFTELGLKDRMAVVMGHYDENMVGLLPANVREGFYSSNTYFMSVDTAENRDYLDRLSRHPDVSGIWPDGNGVLTNFGEGTYLCVKAFAAAAEAAGSIDPEDLVDALETICISGPQGTVKMDPATHHAWVNTHLSRCNADGTFSLVESFGTLPPAIPARYWEMFPGLSGIGELSGRVDAVAADQATHDKPTDQEPAIVRVNEAGVIVEANSQTTVFFGYPAHELAGLSVHLLLPPHLRDQHKTFFDRFLSSEQKTISIGTQGDVLGYRKDGSQFPIKLGVAKAKRDGDWSIVATIFDISELVDADENMRWQTTHDSLTGLLNRTMIVRRLSSALARSQVSGKPVCAFMVASRGLGVINETYGYDAGDRVLSGVADALVGLIAPGDTVGRFGNDRFLIICENSDAKADTGFYRGKILDAIVGGVSLPDGAPPFTVTIQKVDGMGSSFSAKSMLQALAEAPAV